jgi:hypothetical protein
MPKIPKMKNRGKSFLSMRVSFFIMAWVPKRNQVNIARQKATSMGPIPWEKARLEKIPISPQQVAAVMMKRYPVNIWVLLSGKTRFGKP